MCCCPALCVFSRFELKTLLTESALQSRQIGFEYTAGSWKSSLYICVLNSKVVQGPQIKEVESWSHILRPNVYIIIKKPTLKILLEKN